MTYLLHFYSSRGLLGPPRFVKNEGGKRERWKFRGITLITEKFSPTTLPLCFGFEKRKKKGRYPRVCGSVWPKYKNGNDAWYFYPCITNSCDTFFFPDIYAVYETGFLREKKKKKNHQSCDKNDVSIESFFRVKELATYTLQRKKKNLIARTNVHQAFVTTLYIYPGIINILTPRDVHTHTLFSHGILKKKKKKIDKS